MKTWLVGTTGLFIAVTLFFAAHGVCAYFHLGCYASVDTEARAANSAPPQVTELVYKVVSDPNDPQPDLDVIDIARQTRRWLPSFVFPMPKGEIVEVRIVRLTDTTAYVDTKSLGDDFWWRRKVTRLCVEVSLPPPQVPSVSPPLAPTIIANMERR